MIHTIEITVLLQQIDGGLGANATHSWNVVAAIAGERFEVHHLVGKHSELADDAFFADLGGTAAFGVGATAHIEDSDVPLIINKLK